MEGLGGVATYSHVMMQGVEYERARKWMAEEANACIDGAASAGARRICVNDSHGAMHNIFADDLDPRAELVVGTAKPWSMGQGIDGGYDTCFFVGYHGRAGHPKAVLDHTYASRAIYECRLNGKSVGETALNAYLAGHFGATVSLVSGDDATCREGRALVPEVVTVKTKDATGRFSAKMIHPTRVREALREGATRAIELAPKLKPLTLKGTQRDRARLPDVRDGRHGGAHPGDATQRTARGVVRVTRLPRAVQSHARDGAHRSGGRSAGAVLGGHPRRRGAR